MANNKVLIKKQWNVDLPDICPFCGFDNWHVGVGTWKFIDPKTRTNHQMLIANFECLDCNTVFASEPGLRAWYEDFQAKHIDSKARLFMLVDKWENYLKKRVPSTNKK